MKRKTIRLWSAVATAAVAAATAVAITTYAQAGDFSDDLTYDFDCDDKRDAVDANDTAQVDGVDAGTVTVQYSKTGEKVTISQATPGIAGTPEHEEEFGSAVTAYDENGDGCDDLVVGANESLKDKNGKEQIGAGMIWIIPGSQSGLDPKASRGIHQDSPGIPGSVGAGQRFGKNLKGENSTEEPYLLVGASGGSKGAGAVYFLRGGLAYRITQDSPGVSGTSEPYDDFGATLAVNDRYFAIGVPNEEIDGKKNAGMAHVFSLQAVNGTMKQLGAVHQNTPGISGSAEADDGFGGDLSVVPYKATSGGKVVPLLSVGVSGEDIGSGQAGDDAGLAYLITIPSAGKYRQIVSANENTPGVPGETEGGDSFGYSTVLVPTEPSGVATPSSTHWVVAGGTYDAEGENHYTQLYVLNATNSPGHGAKVIEGDDYGLWFDEANAGCDIQAHPKYLYCGNPATVGVPWVNIVSGANEPTEFYKVED